MTPPAFGPRPRDELTAWSNAPSADASGLAPIPEFSAPSPPGYATMAGGQDVFLRRTDGPIGGPHTWYIHGLDGASNNWDRLTAALSWHSTGFAPDLPGQGQTAPPRKGGYSVTKEADLIARMIDRTSRGPVHLVGNSRGGVVATFLAARFPALVRTLTLISPAVPDLRPVRDRGADVRLAMVMAPGVLRPIAAQLKRVTPAARAENLAQSCFGEPEKLTDADRAAAAAFFSDRAALPWAESATLRSLRSLICSQVRPGRWSWWAAANRVTVPALVVWGTRDRMVDARLARKTADSFPDARLLMLARTGHVAQMERPAAVARAMVALWASARATGAPDTATPHTVGA